MARKVLIISSTDGWLPCFSLIVWRTRSSPTSCSATCTSTSSTCRTWIYGARWSWRAWALIWWRLITMICWRLSPKCRSCSRFIGSYGTRRPHSLSQSRCSTGRIATIRSRSTSTTSSFTPPTRRCSSSNFSSSSIHPTTGIGWSSCLLNAPSWCSLWFSSTRTD